MSEDTNNNNENKNPNFFTAPLTFNWAKLSLILGWLCVAFAVYQGKHIISDGFDILDEDEQFLIYYNLGLLLGSGVSCFALAYLITLLTDIRDSLKNLSANKS